MSYAVKSIEEMELYHYGFDRMWIAKADNPVLTTSAGYYNALYGAYAWSQLNLEGNAFSVLPKFVWDISGWRSISARPTIDTTNNTSKGGTAEGGGIMLTAQPSIDQIAFKPLIAQLSFSASTVMEWLANNAVIDTYGGLSALRLYMAVQHKELLNQMLLSDVTQPASTSGGNYGGSNDWETLDRIVSSKAEANACSNSHTGWYNPYNVSTYARDSATTYDSVVDSASGTILTDGNLTNTLITTHLRKVRKALGKEPTVILGSHEVYSELQEIFTPQVRYPLGEKIVEIDVNGIRTFGGQGVGLHVTSVYGIPFIPAKDAPSNSGDANEVGRMFALDTSDFDGFGKPRIGIQVAIPTTYNESTRATMGWPFINSGFVEKGLYWTMGQNAARRITGHGKIRDIQL